MSLSILHQIYYCVYSHLIIPGSSAVEQAAVNRLAGGSNPSRGAKQLFFTSQASENK